MLKVTYTMLLHNVFAYKNRIYVTMQLCTYVQLYLDNNIYVCKYLCSKNLHVDHIAMKFTNAVINNR